MLKIKIKFTKKLITYAVSNTDRESPWYDVDEHLTAATDDYDEPIDEKSIGKIYAVAVRRFTISSRDDELFFSLREKTVAEGFAGNSDPSIRRFYGWRGTTNDVAIHAKGLCRLLTYKQHKNTGRTVLTFERIEIETENE